MPAAPNTVRLVRAALDGDRDAFSTLATRFRGAAFGRSPSRRGFVPIGGDGLRIAEPRFRIWVTIEAPERLRNVPYSVEVDFGARLCELGIAGRFDRHSVRVDWIDRRTRALRESVFCLDEAFLTGSRGRVHWLIEDTDDREYVIRYDVRERGPWPRPAQIGLVGLGDCLRYNDGRRHPLHVGMAANPIAVDWDGDGVTDILSPQIYTYTIGSPWHCARFFRNEGTNARPVFGEGIVLTHRTLHGPEPIPCGSCIEVTDWYGDGLQDLLAHPYGASGYIDVFRNTGVRDASGLPVLERGARIPVPVSGGWTCFRVVDWHGDGRRSILLGSTHDFDVARTDPLWFPATDAERDTAHWPRWAYRSRFDLVENRASPGQPADTAPPVTLTQPDGRPIGFVAGASFEVIPGEHPGEHELLIQDHAPDGIRGRVGIRLFRADGGSGTTAFRDCGRVTGIEDRSSLAIRRVDTPAFRGLLVAPGGAGGKIAYWQDMRSDADETRRYRNRGFLRQQNAYVATWSGYAQGHLCDWDGDGDWDLTAGCETGFVQRFENAGSSRRPIFRAPEFVRQGREIIELLNGPWDDPGSLMEAPIGQTAPMYVDWDGDGVPDLLVAIGRRLLFYRNTGTSARPSLVAPVEVRADGSVRVMKHRNKPAVADLDGSGALSIIGHDEEEAQLLLFRRRAGAGTALTTGEPLRNADGSLVEPRAWHRYTKYFNAADWNGDGRLDLLLSTSDLILYLENVGTTPAPVYRPPVRLSADGKPISIGHHVSTPFPVDWDHSGRLDLLVSGESGLFHLFRRAYLDGEHRRICHTLA